MPISQDKMSQDQARAVADAIAQALTEHTWDAGGDEAFDMVFVPILPGHIEMDDAGRPWVQFPSLSGAGGDWFPLRDIPAIPDEDVAASFAVLDEDDRPLGTCMGILYLHENKGRWIAHVMGKQRFGVFIRDVDWQRMK